MTKDDALVVQETREIVQALPVESQCDKDLVMAIAGSLREGQDRHAVQIKALELAHKRLERKVDKGFELIAKDLQAVKQEAREDRIHAAYAKQAAEQAKAIAEQSWAKLQEVAVGVAKAEAKADGARDIAKTTSRFAGIDPWVPVALTAVIIFIALAMFTRVEKQERRPERESQSSVAPTPAPLPANTYDCAGSKFNGSTVDFSKCRKVSGV